jgi:hypothetical protein
MSNLGETGGSIFYIAKVSESGEKIWEITLTLSSGSS